MELTELQLMTLDASALQRLLSAGRLTSESLVMQSLAQITRHDRLRANLRAMISVVPEERLLSMARRLDQERSRDSLRGPLHGIPIIVKDSIKTGPVYGVPTTVGTVALANTIAKKNASVIDKLEAAGVIILGKTNLNELCNWKGTLPCSGWSAFGGQTQSAYVIGGFDPTDGEMGHSSPTGSSVGSAVGVSAGYSTISIGTETSGSLVGPASRAGLFALKPTVTSTPTDEIWTLSVHLDAVGGMARSVADLAVLTHIIQAEEPVGIASSGYQRFLTGKFDGLRVGFLDPAVWCLSPDICHTTSAIMEQMSSAYFAAMEKIDSHDNIEIVYPVPLPQPSELSHSGRDATDTIVNHECARNILAFLQDLVDSPIRSIEDMIDFNSQHADEELPRGQESQQRLISASESPPSEEAAKDALEALRSIARNNGIDKTLRDHNLNLIAFPGDCLVATIAAAAGYPIATMPLGTLDFNGRPFGLGILAQANREDLMFQFMSAYERLCPSRPVPTRLLYVESIADEKITRT